MMDWGRFRCCFFLFFTGAIALQTLENIEDLKDIEFGHKYPRHGLLLLYWLAGQVSFDQTQEILLQFNPKRRDYGFQKYEISQDIQEAALPELDDSMDRVYYTLGNLNSGTIRTRLPPYVTQDYYNSIDSPNRDIDRIVVRVHKRYPTKADKVYVTQAVSSEKSGEFNQNKTYEISFKLLRQVRALHKPLGVVETMLLDMFGSVKAQTDDPRLALTKEELLNQQQTIDKRLKTIFEHEGVRWLLSLAGYDIDGRYNIHKQTWQCTTEEPVHEEPVSNPTTVCEGQSTVKIEVKSTSKGYTRLTWSGIPKNLLEQGVNIALFRSDTFWLPNTVKPLHGKSSGSADTYVDLEHGLHPRLITLGTFETLWNGPQFDSGNRLIPTEISGYDASLQVFTEGGYVYACLYIRKHFTNWKTKFAHSWVGFYNKETDSDNDYQHYEWVSKFKKVSDEDGFLTYRHKTWVNIGPGVHARFVFSRDSSFLMWNSQTVLARTVPWEKVEP